MTRVWLSSLGVGLGVEGVLQAVADLGNQLVVVRLVELRRRKGTLGLAGQGNQLVDGGNNLLDLGMAKLDGLEDDLFALFLGARLDHHDAVLVTDDHDVDGGGSALGIGRIDDKLAIHAAHTNGANRGAEGNVGESQGAGGGVDAHHVGVIFLVGGEDQCDDLGLVAESIGEQRADGAVDLAAGEDFLFAGTALALDEASGNASTGIGVLAVIHGEGEKVDAFPGVGRSHRGGQNNGFARGDQCGARGLLGHAPSLKNQPLAASKLDSYFMLRHRVLVSFCSLGKLVKGRRRRGCKKLTKGLTGSRARAKEWDVRGGADSPGLRAGQRAGPALSS